MRFRVATLRLAAFSSLLAATLSCGDATGTGVGPAFVEFLDLTDMALRISSNGITGAGGRYCLDVDPQRPNLEITTYTGVRVTNFSPKFQSGGRYTVFVTQNQSGAFQFVTTPNIYTPSAGSQGIRFFNGVSGSYDIYVNDTDSPLTALTPALRNIGAGVASSYVEVRNGPEFLKGAPAGGKSLALYWPPRSFVPGTGLTLVLRNMSGTTVSDAVEDCTVASTQPVS